MGYVLQIDEWWILESIYMPLCKHDELRIASLSAHATETILCTARGDGSQKHGMAIRSKDEIRSYYLQSMAMTATQCVPQKCGHHISFTQGWAG